jgi:hypothetical protein
MRGVHAENRLHPTETVLFGNLLLSPSFWTMQSGTGHWAISQPLDDAVLFHWCRSWGCT